MIKVTIKKRYESILTSGPTYCVLYQRYQIMVYLGRKQDITNTEFTFKTIFDLLIQKGFELFSPKGRQMAQGRKGYTITHCAKRNNLYIIQKSILIPISVFKYKYHLCSFHWVSCLCIWVCCCLVA